MFMYFRCFNGRCGVLTVEIEHVDVNTLEELEREGIDIEPKPFTIRIIQVQDHISCCVLKVLWSFLKSYSLQESTYNDAIMQDKYLQKVHFKQHDVALADFKKVWIYSLVWNK